jgi:hypothetical protein
LNLTSIFEGPVSKEVDEIGNEPHEEEDDACEEGKSQPAEKDVGFKEISG